MKKVPTIAKIIAAVIFVAGIVTLIAVYGDKLVALAKKLMPGKKNEVIDAEGEEVTEEAAEEATEEAPVAEEVDFVG